jgi:hypothetical protein
MKTSVAPDVSKEQVEGLFLNADGQLRTALVLDPNLWQAHWNLAVLELKRFRFTNGQYVPRDGLVAIRRMIELNSNDSGTWYFGAKLAGVIAEVDTDQRLFDECIGYAEMAVKLGHKFDLANMNYNHPFHLVQNDPRFRKLLDMPPSTRMPSSPDRIVPPSVAASHFGAK